MPPRSRRDLVPAEQGEDMREGEIMEGKKCVSCGQPQKIRTPIGFMYLCFSKEGECPTCYTKRVSTKLEKGICQNCGFDVENRRLTQEIACLRAVLERILRVMDESLFVDYQMEKFGQIKYDKELLINSNKVGDNKK